MSQKWTKESLIATAKTCSSMQEFRTKYNGGYQMAFKKGYIKFLYPLLPFSNSLRTRDVYFIYSDKLKMIYVGISYNALERYKAHKTKTTDKVKVILADKNHKFKIISKGVYTKDIFKVENFYINYFKKRKWNLANTATGGSLGSRELFWTKEKVFELALTCDSPTYFARNHSGAYDSAQKNKWLEELIYKNEKKSKKLTLTVDNKTYFVNDLLKLTGLSYKIIYTCLKRQQHDRILEKLNKTNNEYSAIKH